MTQIPYLFSLSLKVIMARYYGLNSSPYFSHGNWKYNINPKRSLISSLPPKYLIIKATLNGQKLASPHNKIS